MPEHDTLAVRLLAGRYEVGELLGHGGMAEVHVGTDTRLGRKVAIKLLKPQLADDPSFRVRFRREAQAAAKMAHPTIVRVFDAGEETVTDKRGDEIQLPFIVMEFVDGTPLTDLVADGPVDVEEATRILSGVLTALEYSHRAGVVHRDIKPGNVMLTASGQVKVMDFGIARAISDSATTVTQTSSILGTATYFSPEQARGENLDARTDLYSAGVLYYELLTGHPPFSGETPVEVAYQHVSELPEPPSTHADVSPAIDAVVMQALEKERDERFQTAAEFRDDAETAASGSVPTKRVKQQPDFDEALFGVAPGRTAAQQAAVRQLTVDDDERMTPTQTRPPVAWIWAGIVTMFVVVAAVLFWVFNISSNPIQIGTSVAMPNVVGMSADEAATTLIDAGLTVRTNDAGELQFTEEPSDELDAGLVTRTDPSYSDEGEGTLLPRDSEVQLWVSSGPARTALPAVEGLGLDQAVAALTDAGFTIGAQRREDSGTVPRDTVISVTPVGEQVVDGQLATGTTIEMVISTGEVTVPDVQGQPSAAAGQTLRDAGLEVAVTIDYSCSGGTVSSQTPAAGSQEQGTTVTLRVCGGTAPQPQPTNSEAPDDGNGQEGADEG